MIQTLLQADSPRDRSRHAVIEVISQGYEFKDLELEPMFYLSQGVKDVVVLDPRSKAIIHSRRDGVVRLESPARIQLECGCECLV
jgi:Putative restriction endonuclease